MAYKARKRKVKKNVPEGRAFIHSTFNNTIVTLTDKEGNVHMTIGRVSFDAEKLVENFNAVYDLLVKIKPSTSKGVYMKNIALTSTMGPSIKVAAK